MREDARGEGGLIVDTELYIQCVISITLQNLSFFFILCIPAVSII